MNHQKHLFQLPTDIHYLNCAYMSPLAIPVEEAGVRGVMRKRNPASIAMTDFFAEAPLAKELFGKLVNANPAQVAIIPSASYALQAAISNIPSSQGKEIVLVSEEFGSDYYTVQRWCAQFHKEMNVIEAPEKTANRGKLWNERLLESISPQTAAVVISSVHWADGTRFDLKAIGQRCRECDAFFIVDGTQSVGALPIDVADFQIDALICPAYKWLMGPYSIGLAFYGDRFNGGQPLEETWMNRTNASVVTNRIFYADDYKPDAARFDMGESSNFALMPMLIEALQLLHTWQPANIQQYCAELIKPFISFLQKEGYWVEEEAYRGSHLFGFTPPAHKDIFKLMDALKQRGIYTSLRGTAVRVSPHLYNTSADIDALIDVLETY